MRQLLKIICALAILLMVGFGAQAQSYSGITTDTSVLTTSLTTVFNASMGIGLGIITVGLLVGAVLKGIRGAKRRVG
jgi:hypothetical protein